MKKLIYLVVIMAIAFVSCNKNENDVGEKLTKIDPDALYAKTEFNLDMRDLAMAVNEAVNTNKSFRKLVKEEALKKIDGDYDILLSNVVGKQVLHNDVDNGINTPNKVKSNFTVKDMLEDAFYTLGAKNKLQGLKAKQLIKSSMSSQKVSAVQQTLIDELIEEYPELQISVPVHAEDLENESYIPPVTFITTEAYKGNAESLIAYKENEILLLDAKSAPSNGVIVVGLNERMDELEPTIDSPPSTPVLSGVTTEAGNRLMWSVGYLGDISYFEIYRIKSGSGNKLIATISVSSTPFIYDDVSELESLAYYTYIVKSYNSYGESSSNHITLQAPQRPNPVKNFEAILQAQNEIELRWDNDNTQYISSTKLFRRFQGIDSDYILYKNFTPNDHYYFDRSIKGGDRIYYQITHNNDMGSSNGRYDFIYVPYRNILEQSPVILDKISYSWHDSRLNDDIEGWFQGLPEFQIKILTVDSKGGTSVVFDEKIQATATGSFSCGDVKLHSWLPSNLKWYDVLTFKVIESDPDWGSLQIKVDAKVNAKVGTDSLGAGIGLTASYTSPVIKFGNGGDDMGIPEYYTYFDPINYTLTFGNYNLST